MSDPCVLIIDDDPGAAEVFVPMLRSADFRAEAEPDAESGLAWLARRDAVAIVLDLHLPRMSALDLLQHLRTDARYAGIPVAVVTGDYLLDDAVTAALDRFGVRLFFKPLWAEDLVQIVRVLLTSPPPRIPDTDAARTQPTR